MRFYPKTRKTPQPWTNWELRILKHYPTLEIEILEQEFGRDKRSIQNKVKKLKLRKRRKWTEAELRIATDYTESRDMNALAILLGPTFDRNAARSIERYAKTLATKTPQ